MALPIHEAAKRGDLDEVMRLVQGDPELVITIDDREKTALHHACWNGHVGVARYLLDRGADVDAKDVVAFTGGMRMMTMVVVYCWQLRGWS